MNALHTILLIISIVSLICVVPFVIFLIVEFFEGPEDTKKLLKKLKIPWSYRRILVIGFISITILVVSYFLRKILSQ